LADRVAREYEVICGARRHWTVAWLRANNYRQFRFLVEVRELSDEEAFRLSDIENRDREDISDYERAIDSPTPSAATTTGDRRTWRRGSRSRRPGLAAISRWPSCRRRRRRRNPRTPSTTSR
jgi:hypothetical protein